MPLIAPTRSDWAMTATGGRIDWAALRDRIDLAAVATNLMGSAPGRRGERGRRLWWSCPIHEDANPSFAVDPGKAWWRCYGCDAKGDAANLVMHLQGMTFPEAVAWLTEFAGGSAPRTAINSKLNRKPSAKPPTRPQTGPDGMDAHEAIDLVEAAADRLWTHEGTKALAYLQGRGLDPETIRAARLGYAPNVQATTRDGLPYQARGIVIPWFDGDRLALVKVRQPDDRRPKYAEVYRNRPGLYIARPILPGRPCLVCEGEFDAILLGQETADWPCGVVTTGSASNRPDNALTGRMVPAWPWLIATDADEAGDRIASAWMTLAPNRCQRVRPPGPGKDWTDAHEAGFNRIRYHLSSLLRSTPSWDDLAALRWGPALLPEGHPDLDIDEPPGILAGL